MQITKISIQKRNPNRVNLYADDKFYVALDKIVAMKLGLKPGLILTPGILNQMDKSQTEQSAWEWALKSLKHSRKSVGIMQDKLRQKFGRKMAEETVEHLVKAGILDDFKYAEDLVESKLNIQLKSRLQLIALLKQKKIPEEIIREVIQRVTPEEDTGTAQRLAAIKNRQLKNTPWEIRREKIIGYLARRGYSYSVIKKIVGKEGLNSEESA